MSFLNKYFIFFTYGKWRVKRLNLSKRQYDIVYTSCCSPNTQGKLIAINFPTKTIADIYLKRFNKQPKPGLNYFMKQFRYKNKERFIIVIRK